VHVVITSCAGDSSIFRMDTVVNSSVGTVYQPALSISASQVIQENGNSSLAKISIGTGNCT